MWHERRQTLPSARRESTIVKKKNANYKRPSLWQRYSLKNPEHFHEDILSTGLGLHPDFKIPTEPRKFGSTGILHLDQLRHLNMGHINERYHQGYFHPIRRASKIQEQQLEVYDEVPIFPLRQVLKEARKSVQPMKIKLDYTLDKQRSTSPLSEDFKAKFDFNDIKDSDDIEDPIYNLSLVKQSGISPIDGKRVPQGSGEGSLVCRRDDVNTKTAAPLKLAPLTGLAAAAQKIHIELVFGPKLLGEKMWPMSTIMRMAPPKELRIVERITPDEQKLDLQKGLGTGARAQMLDFAMKAKALRRQMDPAKYKEEARAYICKGVLHDNAQEFAEAIESYKKYLDICKRLNDVEGQALAHNFIGCSIQEKETLKLTAMKNESLKGQLPETSVVEYEKALEHHKLAAEKSGIEGRFISYTNLGLLCTTLSMWAKAATNHKKALKCATVMENPRGQCASVGNLGFLLYSRKKYEAAKACMIRYLQICKVIYFVPGIARAHFYLGDIEAQFKRYKSALVEFEDALVAAKECNDSTIQTSCKVKIGICKGSLALKDFAENDEAKSIFVNAEED